MQEASMLSMRNRSTIHYLAITIYERAAYLSIKLSLKILVPGDPTERSYGNPYFHHLSYS
jgi:hypothetical protein